MSIKGEITGVTFCPLWFLWMLELLNNRAFTVKHAFSLTCNDTNHLSTLNPDSSQILSILSSFHIKGLCSASNMPNGYIICFSWHFTKSWYMPVRNKMKNVINYYLPSSSWMWGLYLLQRNRMRVLNSVHLMEQFFLYFQKNSSWFWQIL